MSEPSSQILTAALDPAANAAAATPVKRLLLLNQMAGPLFRELAEGLAGAMPEGCTLYTGHPGTLEQAKVADVAQLTVKSAPAYRRQSMRTRLISWLAYVFWATVELCRMPAGTAVVVVSNPPIMAPVVWLIALFRRFPYIVLVYDIYPDIAVRMGFISDTHIIVRLWRRLHRSVYNKAAAVVTIARHMAGHVAHQFDPTQTPLGEVGVLFPWADADQLKPLSRSANPLATEFAATDRLIVLYSGNMGISHDIQSMLEAARILQHRDDIGFRFIGGGAKWQYAKDFKAQYELMNVQVHDYVPEDQLPYSMALADIGLVALDPGAEGMMIPSKVFYYMAVGAAVIGIGTGENDLKEVVERAGCGVAIGHGLPQALAQAIEKLADDPDRRQRYAIAARQAAVDHYTPAVGIAHFVSLMRRAGFSLP